MSKTRSADEVSRVTGAGKRDIENWLARLELTTKFVPTTQGVRRRYRKENALELGFMAAMVRAGAAPKTAAAYARNLLQDLKDHRLGYNRWKQWLVFPAGDAKRATGTDIPDLEQIREEYASAEGAPVFSFIHLQGIVDRVERLFSEESEAD